MINWAIIAAVLSGGLVLLVFWLGREKEKAEAQKPSLESFPKIKEEVKGEEIKATKMVELYFSDGSKLVLDQNSPYYQEFLNCADKIFSKEGKDAKKRAHCGSA